VSGQISLLDWSPPTAVAGPRATEQTIQLARVAEGIERTVYQWCALNQGRSFRLQEFTSEVQAAHDGYCAPDSPARLLRLLRGRGLVQVILVSRPGSLYRVVGVA
jgi:hypothetical protein